MKLFLIPAFAVFAVPACITAQTVTEALRYSTFDILGTARSMGTAGSMSALGGDFSVININPAGAGAYRGSEFSITPGFFMNSTSAMLNGAGAGAMTRKDNSLLLANLGFVAASRPRGGKWKTSNFAIGITKVADYHGKTEYSGSTAGSITDRYAELAFGIPEENLTGEAGLALSAGAIYDFEGDLEYHTDYGLVSGTPVRKRHFIESSGYNSELLFAYGANYDEKLLFGLGLGVPILSYEERSVYREDDRDDAIPYFNALRHEEYLATSGNGINFKAGLIYKPVKTINIGLAYHSRTRYNLTDNFFTGIEYDYTDDENDGPLEARSPDGSFRYALSTPMTLSGSVGVVLGWSGFVAAEVQYKNFSRASFNFTGRGNSNAFLDAQRAVNAEISHELSDALTIRTGGEIAIKKFRFRAGLELDQSPYRDDNAFDLTYNTGVGYRADRWFVDFAFQYYTLSQGLLPYVVTDAVQPFVTRDIRNARFTMTWAYRW